MILECGDIEVNSDLEADIAPPAIGGDGALRFVNSEECTETLKETDPGETDVKDEAVDFETDCCST